jgi:hypothetical protein
MGNSFIPSSLNKYVYAESDPVDYVDPSGHFISLSLGGGIRGVLTTLATPIPRLGFTFVKSASGHIVGVAAATCVLSNAVSRFGLTTSISQFAEACGEDSHRGRWQAQGGGLQADQPWSLSAPLTLSHGLQLLDNLEASLTPKQRRERSVGFEQARIFATRAASAGGLTISSGVYKRSFPNGATKRVDLDIFKGTAFIAN